MRRSYETKASGGLAETSAAAHSPRPGVERLAFRIDEIATCLGVSRRLLEKERCAGRFPRPDKMLGRIPLWTRETLLDYLAGGNRGS
jgi:hypothetical protein